MKAIVTKVFAHPQKVSINGGHVIYYALVEAKTEVGNIVIQDIIKHNKEDIDKVQIGYEFEYGRK